MNKGGALVGGSLIQTNLCLCVGVGGRVRKGGVDGGELMEGTRVPKEGAKWHLKDV